MSSGSIPNLFVFLTFVVSGLFVCPASYAQLRPADPLILQFPRDPFVLRGPGSQIGVSARELKPSETEWQTRLRAFTVKQRPSGVIIEQVHVNGPASRAGLLKGDIITEFDGQPVSGLSQFYRVVEETPPGWTVKAIVFRDGKMREISITPTYGVTPR
jgi:S1-C subfamily serine protease